MRLLRSAALGLALAGLASCQMFTARQPAAPPAKVAGVPVGGSGHPALWKLSDEDTTIWLFGTIHVLPDGFAWRNATIDGAIGSAQGLLLETVLPDDPAAATTLLLGLGKTDGLPPLAERVAPERKAPLAAVIARSGIPAAFLDSLETWAAGLMLVGVILSDLKLNPANGVEEQLTAAFKAAGKPVTGLETPAEQLGFFDTLPEEAQRKFLGTLAEDPGDTRREFDAMLAAWSKGDPAAIAATFDEDMQASPELREALLRRRNANWAAALEQRLATPGTIFVAVGAGHLAGPDALQGLLEAKGLKVERVQ